MTKTTCQWPTGDPLMIRYHDTEWGVPLHDDQKLFEYMVLDAFQAGLSWRTILHKRKNFEQAFHRFDPHSVSAYKKRDVTRLLADPGIVRNRQKIEAAIINAQRFLDIQTAFGSFDAFIWQFTGGRPKINRWRTLKQLPASSRESDEMSKDLKVRGFKFVGTTICYAFMQAAGMVNDHVVNCYRYKEVQRI